MYEYHFYKKGELVGRKKPGQRWRISWEAPLAEREVLSAELRIMGANNSLKGKTSLAIVCMQVITIFYWLEICARSPG